MVDDVYCPDCLHQARPPRVEWCRRGWMVYDNLAGELLAQRDDSAEGDSWRCVRPNKEGGHCGHVVPRRSKVDRTLNELVRGVEAAGD